MRYRAIGQFRKRILGYHVFALTNFEGPKEELAVRCSLFGESALLPVMELDGFLSRPLGNRLFAAPFPLIGGTARLTLTILRCTDGSEEGGSIASIEVKGSMLKWQSRLSYRTKKEAAALLENVDEQSRRLFPAIEVRGVYPLDENIYVMRLEARIPERIGGSTWKPLLFWDEKASEQPPLVLKDTEEASPFGPERHMVFSCRIPRSCENVVFVATPTGSNPSGSSEAPENRFAIVAGIIPQERDACLGEFYQLSEDAKIDRRYPAWFAARRATETDLSEQRKRTFRSKPLISIVTPIYQPPLRYLEEAIASMLAQSYRAWELVLVNTHSEDDGISRYLKSLEDERIRIVQLKENRGIAGNTNAGIRAATGDYVGFLNQDDILEPDALFHYALAIENEPEADLIYCDEDSFSEQDEKPFSPLLKPDFNLDLLYSHNYIVHLLMVSKRILERVELSPDEVNGSQDYDLSLKAYEAARSIVHVPRVLYHWRQHKDSSNAGNTTAKPYAIAAGKRALENHFKRRGIRATVEETDTPYVYQPRFLPPSGNPLVSIIIPTKDHVDYLRPCLASLLEKARYPHYEILLLENNSEEAATFAFYRELDERYENIRIIRYQGPFNYSKIVNHGARHAKGEYLFLLNNDTEAISDGFLEDMLGYFSRPEVGVVGPLLLFPDGLIQQAGLALMTSGRLGFMNQNHSLCTNEGYLGSSSCGFNYSAVLGACQMVRKSVFDQLDGYCEDLAVTYNDVDFCWRIREAGYSVVFTPYSRFYHKEFGSRGSDTASAERAQQTEREAGIMRMRWPEFFALGDPCLNPNCSKNSPYFKLSD